MRGATETLVIGASAAGLATAAELRRRGREFEIVEAEDVVAASWRRHYDRLHLHTPKGFSALPGLPMPKSWPRYPARDQVAEYLELYQEHFDAAERRPQKGGEMGWILETNTAMNRGMEAMGGKVVKRYRIYEREL